MSIKINRALRLSTIGDCRGSALHMLDLIPPTVQAALTARQLAEMIDAMWRACQASKGIANREALAEGAIWDARRQVMREIARDAR